MEPDPTVAVRLKVPLTRPRLVFGLFALCLPVMFIGLLAFIPAYSYYFTRRPMSGEEWAQYAAALPWVIFGPQGISAALGLWLGIRILSERMTVTIVDGKLVARVQGRFGPSVVRRIGMHELAGGEFYVREYPRDAGHAAFRPSFSPRLVVDNVRGRPVFVAGIGLTLAEAAEAREALNRLIASAGDSIAT